MDAEYRQVIIPRFVRRWFRKPYDGFRHFGIVAPGTLYRCGQPQPNELRELIQQLSLRTVVSLRGKRDSDDSDSWEQAERAVCNEFGVEFVSIPSNHKNPPTEAQATQFLDLCRTPERQPILVHCRMGQQRTLLFCGLYRVHVQGIAPDIAESEMESLGFDGGHRRHRILQATFRTLARAALSDATASR